MSETERLRAPLIPSSVSCSMPVSIRECPLERERERIASLRLFTALGISLSARRIASSVDGNRLACRQLCPALSDSGERSKASLLFSRFSLFSPVPVWKKVGAFLLLPCCCLLFKGVATRSVGVSGGVLERRCWSCRWSPTARSAQKR